MLKVSGILSLNSDIVVNFEQLFNTEFENFHHPCTSPNNSTPIHDGVTGGPACRQRCLPDWQFGETLQQPNVFSPSANFVDRVHEEWQPYRWCQQTPFQCWGNSPWPQRWWSFEREYWTVFWHETAQSRCCRERPLSEHGFSLRCSARGQPVVRVPLGERKPESDGTANVLHQPLFVPGGEESGGGGGGQGVGVTHKWPAAEAVRHSCQVRQRSAPPH